MENKRDVFEGYYFPFDTSKPYYLFYAYLIGYQYASTESKWFHKIEGLAGNLNNHIMRWHYILKDESLFEKELALVIKNPKKLSALEKDIRSYTEKTVAILKKVDWKNVSNQQLEKIFNFYCHQFIEVACSAGYIRKLDRAILHRFSKTQASKDNLIYLSMNLQPTMSFEEEIELLELAKLVTEKRLKAKEIIERLEKIQKKYGVLTCGYHEEKIKNLKEYKKQLDELIYQNPEKLIKNLLAHAEEENKKRKSLLEKLNPEERKIAQIASDSTYLKDLYKYSINRIIYGGEPLFKEIGYRTKKDQAYLKDLLPEEITALLKGKEPDKRVLQERAEQFVIILFKEKVKLFRGKEAKIFKEKYLDIKDNKRNEFEGRIACKGYGKGLAKVILKPKDFKKFNKGDILIAQGTNPDFVPTMKKAAAIVAEEGGLTNHVAVISREFGIPCIVGIPDITRLIKDNELIEVDANKGIVRKLNK